MKIERNYNNLSKFYIEKNKKEFKLSKLEELSYRIEKGVKLK